MKELIDRRYVYTNAELVKKLKLPSSIEWAYCNLDGTVEFKLKSSDADDNDV